MLSPSGFAKGDGTCGAAQAGQDTRRPLQAPVYTRRLPPSTSRSRNIAPELGGDLSSFKLNPFLFLQHGGNSLFSKTGNFVSGLQFSHC